MVTISRRSWLDAFGAALARPVALAASPVDAIPSSTSRERIRAKYFPNVSLTTHEGRTVRFYDDLIKDKVSVINVMYATCEGACPGIVSNLLKVQEALGDRVGRDIFMYSITLDPVHDRPKVLKKYAEMHGVKRGWLFLTGAARDIERLRRSLGFTDPDPVRDRDKSSHVGQIRYGNEAMQWWGACPGLSRPDWIVKTILWMRPRVGT
jgi:protein SCO1